MKVLHFVSIMNRAGQETLIMNIYRHIDRNQIQFGFLCTTDGEGDYDPEIKKLGGKIYHMSYNRKNGKIRHLDNYRLMVKNFRKYVKEYETIHIHNYHAFDMFLAASASRTAGFHKVIVHSHNSSAETHLKLHQTCKFLLSRLSLIRLACSKDAGHWMYINENFTVINNGIELENFIFNQEIREIERKELGISNEFLIGHVGRFELQKNHDFLIRLFAEYTKINHNTRLVLAGRGIEFERIQCLSKELGIYDKVLFLGIYDKVPKLYQALDVFVFPSIFEGLPLTMIEAQAADLPCLISDVISAEVDISMNLYRCSLDKPLSEWSEKLEDIRKLSIKQERKNNEDIVREAGYDISTSCDLLTNIYLNKKEDMLR